MPNSTPPNQAANFLVGPSAIAAYSRLSYSMWYALAEFIDNSTQSRVNYAEIIDPVLEKEGVPLRVEIAFDRAARTMTISDNSIGMSREKLENSLKIAEPTVDSKGRSKYGMGMKTASCWIGNMWSVSTTELGSDEEWTATIDVTEVAKGVTLVPLTMKKVEKTEHHTVIRIWELNRNIQKRTEETIKTYLGSMYRSDIRKKKLLLMFNDNQVSLPEDFEIAKSEGEEQKESIDTVIGGKRVTGWVGVLVTGGRKFGGFSLFQNDRQIRGYPDAWKPRSVFGGVDDEGGNSLVSQRLTGELIVDGFEVSHTKDAILYKGTEEEELEQFLAEKTAKLKAFASNMRKQPKNGPWSKEKVAELLEGMKTEFASNELKDVVNDPNLPPLDVIQKNNEKQTAALEEGDLLTSVDVGAGITVKVYLQDRTENDPHLTLSHLPNNAVGVIINQQHPYYAEIDDQARADELIRQYIYDAVAEYRAFQKLAQQQPDAIRKLKDQLLRAKIARLQNEDAKNQYYELSRISDVSGGKLS